jgi:predicted ATPase
LLLRQARKQPLLLIFEDLHWIDAETQAVLDSLVESLGSTRILLLVTYRPEYHHTWAAKTYYVQIGLDALAAESAAELLDALLGKEAAVAPLKQLLGRRGNPFFLEETVRALVETKALEGSPGSYRLTRPVGTIEVPPTVQIILAARIDRLSTHDKRLLQVAAAVGRHTPFSLLRSIADLSEEELKETITRLQAAGFVYETGLLPDLDCSFKHALTQDVAQQHAGAAPRAACRDRRSNRGAVSAVEHRRLAPRVAGEVQVRYLQAGTKVLVRSANRMAATYFNQAVERSGTSRTQDLIA